MSSILWQNRKMVKVRERSWETEKWWIRREREGIWCYLFQWVDAKRPIIMSRNWASNNETDKGGDYNVSFTCFADVLLTWLSRISVLCRGFTISDVYEKNAVVVRPSTWYLFFLVLSLLVQFVYSPVRNKRVPPAY